MMISRERKMGLTLVLTVTLAAVVAGCSGDPDAIAAVPAEGTVTLKGKPLESGTIQLYPDKGRSASGSIVDGKFTLTTYEANDGAVPGMHKVVVTAYKEVKPKGATEPEQKLITPEKYSNPDASTLTIEIPTGGKKDLDIKLD